MGKKIASTHVPGVRKSSKKKEEPKEPIQEEEEEPIAAEEEEPIEDDEEKPIQKEDETDDSKKKKKAKRKRGKKREKSIQDFFGICNPRTPHPRDIDQPTAYHFNLKDLGQKMEGENFDAFEIQEEITRRGGAACNSVMIMKHHKPLPMWFDKNLCARVMHGKWCGYVAYAFRRRIPFGTYVTWPEVPDCVKEEAWADVLSSWDFRTALTEEEHEELKKRWTTYASDRMRNWRTQVAKRYIWDPLNDPTIIREHPCIQYRWMDPKQWDLFVQYRTSAAFGKLRLKAQQIADKKLFYHITGSAGYNKIYKEQEAEKRNAIVEKKVEEGVPREEAENEALTTEVKVDRSVVFVLGNKSRKIPTITGDYIEEIKPEVFRLNKLQDEGNLKLEGKEDILTKVTGKADHNGRYRGCPATTKLPQAMPEYYADKMRKKHSPSHRKSVPGSSSTADELHIHISELDQFTEWVQTQAAADPNIRINPEEYFKQKRAAEKDEADSGEPGKSKDKAPKPCFLNVQDSNGSKKRAAAGIIAGDDSVPPLPGCQCVQIQPPILLPEARLPFYDIKYKNLTAAVGAFVNWPEELIDFGDIDQPKKSTPKPAKKPRTASNEDMDKSDDSSSRSEDQYSSTDDDEDVNVGQYSSSSSDNSSRSSSEEEMDYQIDQNLCTPTSNALRDFPQHKIDPPIRKKFMEFLNELNRHSNKLDQYQFNIPSDVYGIPSSKVHIMLDECIRWIISCNSERKCWIPGWLMDMWGSFVHSMVPSKDRGRVQLVPTCYSFAGNSTDKERKDSLVNRFFDFVKGSSPARLYVMPCCRDQHWTLLIFFPEKSVVYCIDPVYNGINNKKKTEYDLIMRWGKRYDQDIRSEGSSSEPAKQWQIINIKHKHQPFTWECGYYCMLYVEKIFYLHKGVEVQQVFPHDFDAYPMPLIEGLIDSFCRAFMAKFSHLCTMQNGRPRRNVNRPSTSS